MGNDRIFRALDMLAGAAGQEVERSRQFKFQQHMRMEALAKEQERWQREHDIEKGKLEANMIQARAAQERNKLTREGMLLTAAGKAAEEKRLAADAEIKRKLDFMKFQQTTRDQNLQRLTDIDEEITRGYEAGLPEELLDQKLDEYNQVAGWLGVPAKSPVDFTTAREEQLKTQAAYDFDLEARKITLKELMPQILKFNKISPLLDQMEREFKAIKPTSIKFAGESLAKLGGTGILAKFWQSVKSAGAEVGLASETKAFKDISTGMSVQIARMLGDVGNIAVSEREINAKMLPKATDTYEDGMKKIGLFRRLVNSIQQRNWDTIKTILKEARIVKVEEGRYSSEGLADEAEMEPEESAFMRENGTRRTVVDQTGMEGLYGKYKQSRRAIGAQ